MKFEVCLITDIGCKRKNNEDGFYINDIGCYNTELSWIYEKVTAPFITFVLDGVGGSEKGEEATKCCIKTAIKEELPQTDNDIIGLIDKMNKSVCEVRKSIDTASTIAGLFIGEDSIYSFNIGDSKVFSVNRGYLNQLSEDDTLAGFSGENTSEKQPLLQYLGKESIFPHFTETLPSSMFLICTDGLTDMLSIDEIEKIIETTPYNVNAVASMLVKAAKEKGGLDNITVIAIIPIKEEENV